MSSMERQRQWQIPGQGLNSALQQPQQQLQRRCQYHNHHQPESIQQQQSNGVFMKSSRLWLSRWRLAFGLALLFGIHGTNGIPLQANDPSPSPSSTGTVLIPLKRLVPIDNTVNHPASSTLFKKRVLQYLDSTSLPVQPPSPISVMTVGRVGYAGHILIGSPPQRFPVLFDTGSDLALVISDHCQGVECSDLIQFSCSASASCIDLGGSGLLGLDGSGSKSQEHDGSNSNSDGPDLTLQDTLVDTSDSVLGNGGAGVRAETSRMQQLQSDPQQPGSEPSKICSATLEILKMQSAAKTTLPPPTQPLRERSENGEPTKDREAIYSKVHVDGQDSSHANNLVDSNNGNNGANPSSLPLPNFYNQTYVDGSWGAGTFVQDQIQIDFTPMGQVYDPAGSTSLPSSAQPHLATVTFLDVVQDNLGLAQGYDHQISGLLGLTRASPTGRKTFLQELVEQKSLALPVVSMHLEMEGGSFLLGGIDRSQFRGDLIYCPVTDPVTWQISLQGIGTRPRSTSAPNPGAESSTSTSSEPGIGSVASPSPSPTSPGSILHEGIKMLPQLSHFQDAPLILDSGTSSLLIPTAASETIHLELGGTWDRLHRTWFLPCEGTVDLIWWVSEGHGVVQPYESLIYKLEDGRCQSLIFGNSEASYWILGDTWLRGLYVVYDMSGSGRIGIAHATNHDLPGGQLGSGGQNGGDSSTRILTYQNPNSASSIDCLPRPFGVAWSMVTAVIWTIATNIVFGSFS